MTLFSGVLEFNNLFASYKGEGTGAVRHMFSHHILKPERTPIEANVWGTPKSSGSFSNLFRSRLLRAVDYRLAPTEVGHGTNGKSRVCAPPFTGEIEDDWPADARFSERAIYLSCGDSADTGLPDGSIDLIVTDPPVLRQRPLLGARGLLPRLAATVARSRPGTHGLDATALGSPGRGRRSVSPPSCKASSASAGASSRTTACWCSRYHHSRDEGWKALADAVLGGGFTVVNSQPVKAEMSVATPKSQAKEPIQLDIIIVCRKTEATGVTSAFRRRRRLESARAKLGRLARRGSHCPATIARLSSSASS